MLLSWLALNSCRPLGNPTPRTAPHPNPATSVHACSSRTCCWWARSLSTPSWQASCAAWASSPSHVGAAGLLQRSVPAPQVIAACCAAREAHLNCSGWMTGGPAVAVVAVCHHPSMQPDTSAFHAPLQCVCACKWTPQARTLKASLQNEHSPTTAWPTCCYSWRSGTTWVDGLALDWAACAAGVKPAALARM